MTKKDSKNRNLRNGEDQMKDGRYRYRYTDQNGKRKAVYSWRLVSTDKTPPGKMNDICLREKEKQIQKDIEDGIDIDKSNMTLNELLEIYFEMKTKLAITTKNNYIHLWQKHIKNSTIGNMKVTKICKSDILKFYAYLYDEKGFKVGTLQLYQNILYPCFQVAVEDHIIRYNPCTGCMRDYVRGSIGSAKNALSKEEQKSLLAFLKNDETYYPMYSMVACMLGTGMRVSEVNGLTWNDIDFKNKTIYVNHQVLYKDKADRYKYIKSDCKFFVTEPKYNSKRVIPIQDELLHILKIHKKETYFFSKSSTFEIDGYKDFVFINREGFLRTPGSIRRSINGIVASYNKKAKREEYDGCKSNIVYLPTITPHVLRHTYCTRMAESGVDVKVLQELMGHKNIAVTMQVYNHSNLERARQEVERATSVINL